MKRARLACLFLSALLVVLALTASPVFAQEVSKSLTVGKASVVVFAPYTVWQGTNAHVVLKVTNTGSEPLADFKAVLTFPEGQAKNIDYKYKTGKDGVDEATFKNPLKPGETQYLSFTYIKPKTSMPVGTYKGSITVSSGGQSQTVPWNMDLREGTRYQANTGMIVVAILALSLLTMIVWFAYFKLVVNPAFVFFNSATEAVVAILVIALFFGINLVSALAG